MKIKIKGGSGYMRLPSKGELTPMTEDEFVAFVTKSLETGLTVEDINKISPDLLNPYGSKKDAFDVLLTLSGFLDRIVDVHSPCYRNLIPMLTWGCHISKDFVDMLFKYQGFGIERKMAAMSSFTINGWSIEDASILKERECGMGISHGKTLSNLQRISLECKKLIIV